MTQNPERNKRNAIAFYGTAFEDRPREVKKGGPKC